MTMLLGAARYLAETRRFRGTVHFIFQPAEENEGGGRVMVEQGLFASFPMRAVYGMHNWPGLPAGRFAARPGPVMAAFDVFEITVVGKGTHAAMPHLGVDPVVAAAAIVAGLQTIASRAVDPLDSAVVTVTQFHAGDTWNVIPERAVLRGTTRALKPKVQDSIEEAIHRLVESIAAAHGAVATLSYERRYPPTINDIGATRHAIAAAASVVGDDHVDLDLQPSMGAEDFAFMLNEKPGCYIWIGNGPSEGGCTLHNPAYDFNDSILPLGASYWAHLAETQLA
jgi:hippurate hydrolase